MCFRPPSIDFAEIECPGCGALIPMDSEECPECGVAIALNAAAPPKAQMPPAARPMPPKTPGSLSVRAPVPPKAPGQPVKPEAEEIRVPVIGGRIRMPIGMELSGDTSAPEAPTGPGFEEAPDISNTGNYFTSGVYNNG